MSIYWLMAAIATTTPIKPPIVRMPPPMTIDMPEINKAPPEGQESSAKAKSYPRAWASSLDYPSRALMEQREGTTGFRLTVNTEGRVSECAIISSSGHADLRHYNLRQSYRPRRILSSAGQAGEANYRPLFE